MLLHLVPRRSGRIALQSRIVVLLYGGGLLSQNVYASANDQAADRLADLDSDHQIYLTFTAINVMSSCCEAWPPLAICPICFLACRFPAMESSFDSHRQAEAYRTCSGNSGNGVFIRFVGDKLKPLGHGIDHI